MVIKILIFESFPSSHISLQEECSEESKQHKRKKKKHKKVGLRDIGIIAKIIAITINRDNLRHVRMGTIPVAINAHVVARKSHSSVFSLLLWD